MENLIEASESIHSRAFIAINTCAQEKSTLMLGVSMAAALVVKECFSTANFQRK